MHRKGDLKTGYFAFFDGGLVNVDFITGQRLVMDRFLDEEMRPLDLDPNENVLYHLLKLGVGDGHPSDLRGDVVSLATGYTAAVGARLWCEAKAETQRVSLCGRDRRLSQSNHRAVRLIGLRGNSTRWRRGLLSCRKGPPRCAFGLMVLEPTNQRR
jgi:hypothetical protein